MQPHGRRGPRRASSSDLRAPPPRHRIAALGRYRFRSRRPAPLRPGHGERALPLHRRQSALGRAGPFGEPTLPAPEAPPPTTRRAWPGDALRRSRSRPWWPASRAAFRRPQTGPPLHHRPAPKTRCPARPEPKTPPRDRLAPNDRRRVRRGPPRSSELPAAHRESAGSWPEGHGGACPPSPSPGPPTCNLSPPGPPRARRSPPPANRPIDAKAAP